jgi:hypothetical protein
MSAAARCFVTVATKQQIASLRPPAFVQGQRLCRTAHPHPTAEPSWIRHVETIEQLRALLAFKYTYNGSRLTERQPGRVSSEAVTTRRQGIIGLNPIFQRPGLYKRQPTAIARRRYRLIYAASPPRASSCYTCWGPIREEAMIHHLSIAARDPKHAASMLAEIMGGTAVPFPPNPGSFFALQLDEHGSGAEVYPAGTELQPGGVVGGSFVKKDPREYGPTHFALSGAADADTVQAIAQRAGWQCFDCNRGPFHVLEVWVENQTMVEILPPEYAREYLAFTRPDNVREAVAAAQTASARQR